MTLIFVYVVWCFSSGPKGKNVQLKKDPNAAAEADMEAAIMAQLDLDMEDIMKGGSTDIIIFVFCNANIYITSQGRYKELSQWYISGGKKEEPPPAAEEPTPAEDEAKKKKEKKKKKKSETGSEADDKNEGVDNMSTVKENENDEVFEDAKGEGTNIGPRVLSIIQLNLIFHFNISDILYFWIHVYTWFQPMILLIPIT